MASVLIWITARYIWYTLLAVGTSSFLTFFAGGVAQGLEQRAHNLLVVGSNPTTPTIRS